MGCDIPAPALGASDLDGPLYSPVVRATIQHCGGCHYTALWCVAWRAVLRRRILQGHGTAQLSRASFSTSQPVILVPCGAPLWQLMAMKHPRRYVMAGSLSALWVCPRSFPPGSCQDVFRFLCSSAQISSPRETRRDPKTCLQEHSSKCQREGTMNTCKPASTLTSCLLQVTACLK